MVWVPKLTFKKTNIFLGIGTTTYKGDIWILFQNYFASNTGMS